MSRPEQLLRVNQGPVRPLWLSAFCPVWEGSKLSQVLKFFFHYRIEVAVYPLQSTVSLFLFSVIL